ncbi:MAG: hypothetical protein Ct9H90mP27_2200 [Gammaproteobacteria bacterium]|nr:MAG: hypothetical protein Ct9H90mP27_2200 [Gammaproteobacteria bacterium]
MNFFKFLRRFSIKKKIRTIYFKAEKVVQEEGRVYELIRKASEKIEKLGRKISANFGAKCCLLLKWLSAGRKEIIRIFQRRASSW